MRGAAFVLVCAALAAAAACDGGGGACPSDLPDTCPTPAPSFSAEVAAVVQRRCAPCHAPGGQEATRPFQTYTQIFTLRTSILNQVYTCRMPPAGAAPLTMDERQALLGWLVCGAPNN